MKKLIQILGILALMLAGTACNNSDKQVPINGEVLPVSASDDVTEFFRTHLPSRSGSRSECFFVGDSEAKCLMINSAKELMDIMYSSVELPVINFEKHTLVIGQIMVGETHCTPADQSIDVGTERSTLNLTINRSDWSFSTICPLYYWGLYLKLPKMAIDVKETYSKLL